MTTDREVERLLDALRKGDDQALDDLFGVVYDELRRLARVVRQGRAGETLNTTALVHEAYTKLVPSGALDLESRTHFFRVVARAMRQVLVNAAEAGMAAKRGGDWVPVTLTEHPARRSLDAESLLDLEEGLRELEAMDPRQVRIVEYRFFAGLGVSETARMLGVSEPTVKRDWRAARAWLAQRLI